MEDGVKRARRKAGAAVLSCALLAGGTVAVARAAGAGQDAAVEKAPSTAGAAAAPGAQASTAPMMIYDGGLASGWKDIGWAPRELPKGAPARMRLFNYGGWILYRPKLEGSFGALSPHAWRDPRTLESDWGSNLTAASARQSVPCRRRDRGLAARGRFPDNPAHAQKPGVAL